MVCIQVVSRQLEAYTPGMLNTEAESDIVHFPPPGRRTPVLLVGVIWIQKIPVSHIYNIFVLKEDLFRGSDQIDSKQYALVLKQSKRATTAIYV